MQELRRFFTALMCSLFGILVFINSACFAANTPSTYNASPPNTNPPNYKADYKGAGNYKNEKLPPLAQPLPPPPPLVLKEGAYFGLGGGYDSYKVHETIPVNGFSISSLSDPAINGTGLVGELFAGYGHYFNNILYLGLEIFGNESSVYQNNNIAISDSVSTDAVTYNSKFIVTAGYGISLFPGVKLSDSGLFFLRLGYHIARLRGQENRLLVNGTTIVNDTSSWDGGFGYGLGFEQAMVENLSLRGEYVHIDYRTFNAGPSSGTEYSPSNNQFMLSLIYHL